jgi:hypothetical protein
MARNSAKRAASARSRKRAPETLTAIAVSSPAPVPDRVIDPAPPHPNSNPPAPQRVFLLSPANANGIRARLILRENAVSPLARRLREASLSLGEAFSFISGLYFRGKLAYAQAFANPPQDSPGALVITSSGGLIPPETPVTRDDLRRISAAPISLSEPRYRLPLERDARLIAGRVGINCEIVLLGSVATPKYVEPLLAIFGERLLFPAEFAGRGDMSRGGLMLRCVQAGIQLSYVPVATANRHAARPPKLSPLSKWDRGSV